jgi:signal transduction histidine kinase
LEARLGERTRIARELHDTLLQSLHGLMFRFQAARNMLPGRPEQAMQDLDGAIARTEQAIAESRGAIRDLRSEPVAQSDLAELLMAMRQELATFEDANCDGPVFRVIVEGERRRLSPILQAEVYGIARELLRNAFQHASAHRIEAEIRYEDHLFRLRVRDDGKGMDPKVLEAGGRTGHWGLAGVRERAQKLGVRLDFWSEAGAGTEVQLTVPAAVAYENSRDGAKFRLFRKARIHEH